jgi:hypothetical protein
VYNRNFVIDHKDDQIYACEPMDKSGISMLTASDNCLHFWNVSGNKVVNTNSIQFEAYNPGEGMMYLCMLC